MYGVYCWYTTKVSMIYINFNLQAGICKKDKKKKNDKLQFKLFLVPLTAGFMLQMDDGSRTWEQCRYERVHKLCVRCGLIGHTRSQCNECMDEIERMLIRQHNRIQRVHQVRFGYDSLEAHFHKELKAFHNIIYDEEAHSNLIILPTVHINIRHQLALGFTSLDHQRGLRVIACTLQ